MKIWRIFSELHLLRKYAVWDVNAKIQFQITIHTFEFGPQLPRVPVQRHIGDEKENSCNAINGRKTKMRNTANSWMWGHSLNAIVLSICSHRP